MTEPLSVGPRFRTVECHDLCFRITGAPGISVSAKGGWQMIPTTLWIKFRRDRVDEEGLLGGRPDAPWALDSIAVTGHPVGKPPKPSTTGRIFASLNELRAESQGLADFAVGERDRVLTQLNSAENGTR